MASRSWPWKKKSSDKSAAEKAIATLDSVGVSLPSGVSETDKDNCKKPNYVQISVESYAHLNGLEDQMKAYEEQVKTYEDQLKALDERIEELNEKLSDAHNEMINKDEIVKQHAKVAEEAVSGWEKAEAEAAALKTNLEAVTISKLTAEDRAAHLDGALKECMRQIRNLKDEHDQKVQDVVVTKNMQYDKMKHEFEARMAGLDQELLRSEAENAALSRSLQERSNMLMKMSEEKSQAEAEIEHLKSNIESCEREINSLKYELHIVSKELDIRNEEKNMSVKSAELANKQQMEGVKKIAKLEAECQRLRGLVRKKLPGPAALAQMKLEVESLGRDYGETRHRRSPVKPASPLLSPNPHMPPVPECSLDGSQKLQKENEFLTERLLAMEEETKMLKEALAKRNSELQASRSMCAKTANKLHSLEAQLHTFTQPKGSAESPSIQNNSLSLTSMSEDGNDDADSSASALISGRPHIKDKHEDKSSRIDSTNHLELMDDFLEMEKLARLSHDSNGAISFIGTSDNKGSLNHEANGANVTEPEVNSASKVENTTPDADSSLMMKIQSRISKVFESVSDDAEIGKVLEELKHIVQELYDSMHPHSISCIFEERRCSEDALVSSDKEIALLGNDAQATENEKVLSPEMVAAISEIHTFILSLAKAAAVFRRRSDEEDGLNCQVERFSASFNKAVCNEVSLADFVVALSHVVVKASDLCFNFLGFKNNDSETNTPDCIDKVALPENKASQVETYPNGCSHISDSSSNPEVLSEASFLPSLDAESLKCSMEELEQLKMEKDNVARELARSMDDLETRKSQLKETEQVLAEVKSQLASSQKTNSLAETQLKCMAESYKLLEKRAEELETEVSLLQTKVESLEIELQSEKASHQDALMQCKELQEEMRRNKECSMCSSMAADVENKSKQEKELAAAAGKLAECQETIFLLGRQLKALRPQTDVLGSPHSEKNHKDEELVEEELTTSGVNSRDSLDQAEVGADSPLDIYNSPLSPSDTDTNGHPRSPLNSKSTKYKGSMSSGSSSTSSSSASEKHSRGFSRFFSSKSSSRH